MAILKTLFTSLSLSLLAGIAAAEDAAKPKLGPAAIPITADNAYLRKAEAPDYWAISAYYIHQQTSSACSLASVTIAVNAMRGLPALSEDTLVTQNNLLEATKDTVARKFSWLVAQIQMTTHLEGTTRCRSDAARDPERAISQDQKTRPSARYRLLYRLERSRSDQNPQPAPW